MSVNSFEPLTDSQIDEILTLNSNVIGDATQTLLHKTRIRLSIPDSIQEKLSSEFGIVLTSTVPAQLVKGDTPSHKDSGSSDFSFTYLMYLTNSEGNLVIDGKSYPIKKGSAYKFAHGLEHGTTGTGESVRLSIGPFNEFEEPVGIPGIIYRVYSEDSEQLEDGIYDEWSNPYIVLQYQDASVITTPGLPPGKRFVYWSMDDVHYLPEQSITLSQYNSHTFTAIFEDIASSNPCLENCNQEFKNVQTDNRTENDKSSYINNRAVFLEQTVRPRQMQDYATYMKYVMGKAHFNAKKPN